MACYALPAALPRHHTSAARAWSGCRLTQVLSSMAPGVHSLEVLAGDDVSLQPHDLAAIAGEEAQAPEGSPARGAGTAASGGLRPDGASGAVFVLGSALGTPGGATLMLQLVNHLRRRGFFVAVALTRPFRFEGARKLEQADALVETLEQVAHLVVSVGWGALFLSVNARDQSVCTGPGRCFKHLGMLTLGGRRWRAGGGGPGRADAGLPGHDHAPGQQHRRQDPAVHRALHRVGAQGARDPQGLGR